MEKQLKTQSGPAWQGVRYFTTTIKGGFSQGDWAGLNLGEHCGDNPKHVEQNRALLKTLLPSAPHWLQQLHSTQVYQALRPAKQVAHLPYEQAPLADAAWTTTSGTVLAVLTADCLPIVIADTQGQVVGVAHAGWRGLAAGVVERLFFQLQKQVAIDAHWQAWIGPAISQANFEVGSDVYEAFVNNDHSLAHYFIKGEQPQKYFANLTGLAANQLRCLTHNNIAINFSNACTYAEKSKYYSYRRQASTGRMVTLAWLV